MPGSKSQQYFYKLGQKTELILKKMQGPQAIAKALLGVKSLMGLRMPALSTHYVCFCGMSLWNHFSLAAQKTTAETARREWHHVTKHCSALKGAFIL